MKTENSDRDEICLEFVCPAETTFQIIGGKWRPRILWELSRRPEPLRFGELQTALGETDLAPSDMEEEIDTVGGLVTAVAGRVPQRGEVITHPAGFEIEVTDADPRRVKRVRIRRAVSAAEA